MAAYNQLVKFVYLLQYALEDEANILPIVNGTKCYIYTEFLQFSYQKEDKLYWIYE